MAGRSPPLIVVIDASVFISAVLKTDSIPERALLTALGAGNTLALSDEVEAEFREVLARPKFDRLITPGRRQALLDLVVFAAERFRPSEPVHDCLDPSDNRYLALALACTADVIVSSDEKHLLPMSPWRGIPILRPSGFVQYALTR